MKTQLLALGIFFSFTASPAAFSASLVTYGANEKPTAPEAKIDMIHVSGGEKSSEVSLLVTTSAGSNRCVISKAVADKAGYSLGTLQAALIAPTKYRVRLFCFGMAAEEKATDIVINADLN